MRELKIELGEHRDKLHEVKNSIIWKIVGQKNRINRVKGEPHVIRKFSISQIKVGFQYKNPKECFNAENKVVKRVKSKENS